MAETEEQAEQAEQPKTHTKRQDVCRIESCTNPHLGAAHQLCGQHFIHTRQP